MGCRRITYNPLQNAVEANLNFSLSSRGKTDTQAKNRLNAYAFGFNGKEKDDPWKGSGNSYDYGFRIYNPQVARFLSIDPLTKDYPWYTPYQFAGNKPIWAIDLDGLEEYVVHKHFLKTARGKPALWKMDYKKLSRSQAHPTYYEGYFIEDDVQYVTGGMEYKSPFFKGRARSIKKFEPVKIFNKIIREGKSKSTVFVGYEAGISFGENGGRNVTQVSAAFDGLTEQEKDHIDAMISILSKDGAAKMVVTGTASPRATSMDGELPNSSKENNEILAEARAQAGVDFIVKYAMENYNVDVSGRISKVSRVQNSTPEEGDDAAYQGDQMIEFNISDRDD